MKRENNDVDQGGMKLRSGKVIVCKPSKLPKEVDDILEHRLQNFKKLFSGNKEHAKELLKTINKAQNIEIRFDIKEKIEEVYNKNNPEEINPLLEAAGSVSRVLIYNPEYRDIIKTKIKSFDLEIPILGSDEHLTEEL